MHSHWCWVSSVCLGNSFTLGHVPRLYSFFSGFLFQVTKPVKGDLAEKRLVADSRGPLGSFGDDAGSLCWIQNIVIHVPFVFTDGRMNPSWPSNHEAEIFFMKQGTIRSMGSRLVEVHRARPVDTHSDVRCLATRK